MDENLARQTIFKSKWCFHSSYYCNKKHISTWHHSSELSLYPLAWASIRAVLCISLRSH